HCIVRTSGWDWYRLRIRYTIVCGRRQGQAVGAGAKVDYARRLRRTKGDHIVQTAAGNSLGVGDRQRVVAGRGEDQRVGAGAEIDGPRGLRRGERDRVVAGAAGEDRKSTR